MTWTREGGYTEGGDTSDIAGSVVTITHGLSLSDGDLLECLVNTDGNFGAGEVVETPSQGTGAAWVEERTGGATGQTCNFSKWHKNCNASEPASFTIEMDDANDTWRVILIHHSTDADGFVNDISVFSNGFTVAGDMVVDGIDGQVIDDDSVVSVFAGADNRSFSSQDYTVADNSFVGVEGNNTEQATAAASRIVETGFTFSGDVIIEPADGNDDLTDQRYNYTSSFVEQASSGQTIAVNQVSETDLAQPLSSDKVQSIGQALETDSALPISPAKQLTIGQAAETDTALPLGASKTNVIGQASESDTALPLVGVQNITVNTATETDIAQPLGSAKVQAIGQALEVDTALPLGASKQVTLGQASEVDTAQPLTVGGRITVPIGQALETDLALPFTVTGPIIIPLGLVQEFDTAQPIGVAGPVIVTIGQAQEFDSALPITIDAGQVLDALGDPGAGGHTRRARRATKSIQPPARRPQYRANQWNMFIETYDAFLRRQQDLIRAVVTVEDTLEDAQQAIERSPAYSNALQPVRNVILEQMAVPPAQVKEAMDARLEDTLQAAIDEQKTAIDEQNAAMEKDQRDILALAALAVQAYQLRH